MCAVVNHSLFPFSLFPSASPPTTTIPFPSLLPLTASRFPSLLPLTASRFVLFLPLLWCVFFFFFLFQPLRPYYMLSVNVNSSSVAQFDYACSDSACTNCSVHEKDLAYGSSKCKPLDGGLHSSFYVMPYGGTCVGPAKKAASTPTDGLTILSYTGTQCTPHHTTPLTNRMHGTRKSIPSTTLHAVRKRSRTLPEDIPSFRRRRGGKDIVDEASCSCCPSSLRATPISMC